MTPKLAHMIIVNFFDIFVFLLSSLIIGPSITSMLAGTGVMTIFVNK